MTLAAVSGSDLATVLFLVAVAGFGLALFLASRREYVGAVVTAFIAALVLIFGT